MTRLHRLVKHRTSLGAAAATIAAAVVVGVGGSIGARQPTDRFASRHSSATLHPYPSSSLRESDRAPIQKPPVHEHRSSRHVQFCGYRVNMRHLWLRDKRGHHIRLLRNGEGIVSTAAPLRRPDRPSASWFAMDAGGRTGWVDPSSLRPVGCWSFRSKEPIAAKERSTPSGPQGHRLMDRRRQPGAKAWRGGRWAKRDRSARRGPRKYRAGPPDAQRPP
jgi:hypothetical protein